MTKYPQLRTTCEYCGYTENDKKDKKNKRTYDDNTDGREHAIFSCEHVLEVGLLWLFMGISFKSPKLDTYVKELYQSNYRMSCCRCNFIKADIQVNKSIVPESTTGEPTIFVGWNPAKKQFYVNMKAINEFARLVMCFSMRTAGASGKGHKHIIDHLSTLGTTVSEASVKIVKNTTICVKECVQRMNTLIFDIVDGFRDSDTNKQLIKKKRLFNPCVARLSAYSTVYDLIETKKDGKGQRGGGLIEEITEQATLIAKEIYEVQYGSRVRIAGLINRKDLNDLTGVALELNGPERWTVEIDAPGKEFGNQYQIRPDNLEVLLQPKLFDNSEQSELNLNLKLRLMLTLDKLLDESLEYKIYRDFADFAAV